MLEKIQSENSTLLLTDIATNKITFITKKNTHQALHRAEDIHFHSLPNGYFPRDFSVITLYPIIVLAIQPACQANDYPNTSR